MEQLVGILNAIEFTSDETHFLDVSIAAMEHMIRDCEPDNPMKDRSIKAAVSLREKLKKIGFPIRDVSITREEAQKTHQTMKKGTQ